MDQLKILETLTDCDGVSGDEKNICETVSAILKSEIPHIKTEIRDNNLIAFLTKKDPNKKTLLLDAHIDRIGFIVTHITENGFLKVGNIGKTDTKILPAARVYVGEKRLPGVICTKPPHLSDKESKPLSVSDILIDVGLDKKATEEKISVGDRVLLHEKFTRLQGDRIAASALDNRAGAAAIIMAMRKIIAENSSKYNVVLLFSSCEEVNERGAIISTFSINPDIAIVVDVTFAYSHGEDKDTVGEMGKGVMIGVSATLDKEFSNALIDIAKAENIPFQVEVMPQKTGTNADMISTNRGGVKTATLSIPLKFMHTQSEVVSLSDIASTADLISAFARS
ncbi:MAG: M20/M25/M40 family metallo-hydrolase [Ruminococcus sp.]|nr:M20/M25/M40 family metallo-hydrolase [Ruminococcus sp.]